MSSTVTWGNIMALILPGMVFLLGVGGMHPVLAKLETAPNDVSASMAGFLLLLAALVGGIADGFRRVTTERTLKQPDTNIYAFLTPKNLPLFEAGVENSYRYYTFYGNLAVVAYIVIVARLLGRWLGALDALGPSWLLLLLGSLGLEYASRIQHRYFVGFCEGFIASEAYRREHPTEEKD